MTLRDTQAELHRVSDQLDTARRHRQQHQRQAAMAQAAIDQLGPIGRRLHRRQLHEHQTRHADATANLDHTNDHIEHLAARHKQLTADHERLTADVERRTAELAAHTTRPDRPPNISDPTIDLHALLEAGFRARDRAANRTPDHEPDTGMDLGR